MCIAQLAAHSLLVSLPHITVLLYFSCPRGNTQMLAELKSAASFSLISILVSWDNKFRDGKVGAYTTLS